LPPRSCTLRVWLPSRCFSASIHLGSLFQLPTLLGFALQSFLSSQVIRFRKVSLPTFHSCAFLQNLSGLVPALQWLPPTWKAVLLLAPRGFTSGRSRICSPGLFGLSGSPFTNRLEKRLPSLVPLSSFGPLNLSIFRTRNPRVFQSVTWLSPFRKRAPARLTFLTDRHPPPI
jgi:hypothetical protein